MKSFVSHESFYLCDCGYEAVLLRQFTYPGTKNGKSIPDPQVELAVFSNSCKCKTWKEQLRWIWHIFCNHQIWADQVILNVDEMERLGNTLLMLSKHIKEDNIDESKKETTSI